MERARLLQHLENANKDAEANDILIKNQQRLIMALVVSGDDTTAAERALQVLEETRENCRDHIERLRAKLGELPPEIT